MIQSDRMLEEFLRLISFDSEPFCERDTADYLLKTLRELGLTAEEDDADAKNGMKSPRSAGNVFAVLEETAPGEPILFSAHMDTDKPGIGKRAFVRADGVVVSDGATVLGADDAAGIATILEALRTLLEHNMPHPRLEFLFPAAEEIYGRGSEVFDYTKLTAKIAYAFDLTEEIGTAALAAPTILSLGIVVTGRSAHAGFNPEDGINALTAAANALSMIPTGRVSEDTTVNFGTIRGGSVPNAVPGKIEIVGEVRSMRHEEALRHADLIRSVFAKEAEKLGARTDVLIEEKVRAYEIGEDEEVVRRFVRAAEAVHPASARLTTTFGGSDNNHFAKHGVRGIVLASAMHDVHTTREYTTVKEMAESAEIALRLMTEVPCL